MGKGNFTSITQIIENNQFLNQYDEFDDDRTTVVYTKRYRISQVLS